MNGNLKKMNSELEKKWFVYLSDHHEGPFSAAELSQKQKIGQITLQSYVWKEGMPDWLPIPEVPELVMEMKKNDSSSKVSLQKPKSSPGSRSRYPKLISVILVLMIVLTLGGLSLLSRLGNDELHASIRPLLNRMTETMPFLTPLFKMVPASSDWPSQEKAELTEALKGAPEKAVRIAIAVIQSDPSRPQLLISTNLPDQTQFDVYLIGKGETLLNRIHYSSKFSVKSIRGIAKSEVLLTEEGQPLSKGEYSIWITESQEQDESLRVRIADYPQNRPSTALPAPIPNSSKFVLNKNIFLGGARDESYLTKLKAFHEKIKQNSDKELVELRQYSDILGIQFQTLTQEFEKILKSRKVSDAQRVQWKMNSKKWLDLNAQLEQSIQTWSKETLQNEFFYGSAYELVKGSYESLKSLFNIENEYVEKPADKNTFLIQHGKAISESRQSLEQLRGKIDLILNAPKSANGLPAREGI